MIKFSGIRDSVFLEEDYFIRHKVERIERRERDNMTAISFRTDFGEGAPDLVVRESPEEAHEIIEQSKRAATPPPPPVRNEGPPPDME